MACAGLVRIDSFRSRLMPGSISVSARREASLWIQRTSASMQTMSSACRSFRNDYNPRMAVTVDMIATGTDVKPLEVLLFMRDVRSRGYYEQMKGRGVRSLDFEALRKVSNSADSAKTRFVLIDAVGVEKSCKTESRPLERKPTVPLKDLMMGIAMGHRDEDTVLSLANRLVRMAKQLDDKAKARIEKHSGGIAIGELGKALIVALDPDKVAATALRSRLESTIPRVGCCVGFSTRYQRISSRKARAG